MSKLTADTITDEQIRELRCAIRVTRKTLNIQTIPYDRFLRLDYEEHQCRVALDERRANRGFTRIGARVRCAEILNERGGK